MATNSICWQDRIVFLLLAGLLLYGTLTDDPYRDFMLYHCYAIAFWHGWSAFENLGLSGQCAYLVNPDSQNKLLHALQQWDLPSRLMQFVAAQSPDLPYHAFPYEYPSLAILLFSLGLHTLPSSYQVSFALWMILFAGCIYLVLVRWRSRQAARAYCLYVVLGGWITVGGRFDIVPAALTLFAVISTGRKRWNWAFACLALATLLKMYPAILLVPFVLALQQETRGTWYAWRRWQPVAVFVGICVLVIGISLLLSVAGTVAPLEFFINRPVQMESLSASILWVASVLWKTPLTITYNVVSPLSGYVTLLMNVLLAVGVCSTWRLQRRGRIDLAMACLLTLLIVLVTAKVFSPQYLIWVIPLVAYVGQTNRWWLLFWIPIAFLTSWPVIGLFISWISPHITFLSLITEIQLVTIRNFLLLGFTLSTLISSHFSPTTKSSLGGCFDAPTDTLPSVLG